MAQSLSNSLPGLTLSAIPLGIDRFVLGLYR
jgi:hypothetical protein